MALVMAGAAFSAAGQFRYGPTVGVSMTDLHFKQDLFKVEQQVGFGAGIAAEMMFPGVGFGIDLGLSYEMRGAKLDLGSREMWASQGLGNEPMRLHTIVLPIHLRFKYTRLNGFEDKLAPIVYAGPQFGFVAGHSKLANSFEYAGADLGIDFGFGAEIFRRWQVTFGYTLGMTYVTKAKILTNFSARNRIWNLKLVYFLK